MWRINNLFSILFLLPVCLVTAACVKDSTWSDYIEKYSSSTAQKQYSEAEKLLGADNADKWWYLNNIGESFHREANYDKAESYYKRANEAAEKALGHGYSYIPKRIEGKDIQPTARLDDLPPKSLDNLARLYQTEGKYTKAEMLYEHWAKLLEQQFGSSDPGVAICLSNLAELYHEEGKHKLADKYQSQADAIKNSAQR